MKKSQLRKLIQEGIKELIVEQGATGTYVTYARSCTGGTTLASVCWRNPNGPGNPIQVGDALEITSCQGNCTSYGQHVGRSFFVKNTGGPCSSIKYNAILGVPCPKCCHNSWGGAGATTPSGACTLNCGQQPPSSGCDPSAWSNHSNWISNWTNSGPFNSSNPNQPCNHICGQLQTWTNNLSGAGPVQTNQLNCKIDEGNNQAQIHNCNC